MRSRSVSAPSSLTRPDGGSFLRLRPDHRTFPQCAGDKVATNERVEKGEVTHSEPRPINQQRRDTPPRDEGKAIVAGRRDYEMS